MKNFNSTTMGDNDYNTSQSNLNATPAQPGDGQQRREPLAELATQQPHQQQSARQPGRSGSGMIVDEMSQDLQYLAREAPLDGGESTFGTYSTVGGQSEQPQQVTSTKTRSHTRTVGRTESGGDENFDNEDDYDNEQHRPTEINEFDYRLDEDEQQNGRRANGAESPEQAQQFVRSESVRLLEQMQPDNVDIQRPLQQAGFLVSFMVDARGGAMRGCRHSGVRVIIPPATAQMPMRITCRYLRKERLVHPPPLMEGEACASKIMEVGPAGAKFLGPVLIEVPHFASLRGKEREIIILRSDSGEVWREHLVEPNKQLIDEMIRSAEEAEERIRAEEQDHGDQENSWRPSSALGGRVTPFDGYESASGAENNNSNNKQQQEKRITRIVTTEFPQYFAIISRIKQEVHTVGPEGSTVDSQVVPKVQATFTDGALTKRIKIGLQGKQDESGNQDNGRAQSPTSQQSTDGSTLKSSSRPGSKTRRRRFLACFGASHGSRDHLNDQMMSSSDDQPSLGSSTCASAASSSLGGDSPRVPVNEKLVERRIIIEDISDSEEARDSSAETEPKSARKKRHVQVQVIQQTSKQQQQQQLVPDDYYIEQEQPFILNVEPKTYGKRMADSSVQTDSKSGGLHSVLASNSTRTDQKRRSGVNLLGRKRRRNKQQLTIHCGPTGEEQEIEQQQQQQQQQLETIDSPPRDSSKSLQGPATHNKSRTCTIQTDSDSVIVNYVTIHPSSAEAGTQVINDDGYVSGGGDLNKKLHNHEHHHRLGKGLFSPFCASVRVEEEDEDEVEVVAAAADDDASGSSVSVDDGKPRKSKKSKTKKKLAKPKKSKNKVKVDAALKEEAKVSGEAQKTLAKSESLELEPTSIQSDNLEHTSGKQTTSGAEDADESLMSTSSSKELKLKIKLDKQERSRREKLEKQQRKEAEEAAARAEKERKKAEKEAKKAEKLAEKAIRIVSQSPTGGSRSETPVNDASISSKKDANTTSVVVTKTVQSVKFASSPSHEESDIEQSQQRNKTADYELEKARMGQEDGRDLIRLSIGTTDESQVKDPDQVDEQQQVAASSSAETLQDSPTSGKNNRKFEISLNDGAESKPSKFKLPKFSLGKSSSSSSQNDDLRTTTTVDVGSTTEQPLKPILKHQQSSSIDEPKTAEIIIGEPTQSVSLVAQKLVSEATDEAVKAADEQLRSAKDQQASILAQSKREAKLRLKEEKKRLAELSKSISDEERRLSNEAKKQSKDAEEARKRAELEANKNVKRARKEAERQADIAKIEAERAIQAIEAKSTNDSSSSSEGANQSLETDIKKVAKLADKEATKIAKQAQQEARRIEKEAEQEAKKQAKLARAEADRLAKEAKQKLKLDKKLTLKAGAEIDVTAPSAPLLELEASGQASSVEVKLPEISIPSTIEVDMRPQLEPVKVEIETQKAVQAEAKDGEKLSSSIAETKVDISSSSKQEEPSSKSKSSFGFSLPKFDISFVKRKSDSKTSSSESSSPIAATEQAAINQVEDPKSEVTETESTSESSKSPKSSSSFAIKLPKVQISSKKGKQADKEVKPDGVVEEPEILSSSTEQQQLSSPSTIGDEHEGTKPKSPKRGVSFGISLPKFSLGKGKKDSEIGETAQSPTLVSEPSTEADVEQVDQSETEESFKSSKSLKNKSSFSISLPKFGLKTRKGEKTPKDKVEEAKGEDEPVQLESTVVEVPSLADQAQEVLTTVDVQESSESFKVNQPKVDLSLSHNQQQEASIASEVDSKKKQKKQKKEKAKSKKQKGNKSKDGDSESLSSKSSHADEPTSTSETVSKSSFFGRLFRSKPKTVAVTVPSVQVPKSVSAEMERVQIEGQQARQELEEPVILSEMYPSDPNNADGEMILEVNVPQNLIERTQQQADVSAGNISGLPIVADQQHIQQHRQSLATSTTMPSTDQEDQEATLVNISQMADDEATENVVSEANDLDLMRADSPEVQSSQMSFRQVVTEASQKLLDRPSFSSTNEEGTAARLDSNDPAFAQTTGQAPPTGSKSLLDQQTEKVDLKDEKKRRELEQKLEKEAKKRDKEEARLKKKQEKEAKKLAELEAKKRAKEEESRLKLEASEAKRLAKLAKKQAKEESKKGKKSKQLVVAETAGTTSAAAVVSALPATGSEVTEVKTTSVSISRPQQASLNESSAPVDCKTETTIVTKTSSGSDAAGGIEHEIIDTSNMMPVNEETEVERIVEEEIGDDGTVTKRTKVVETKYVTLRQEEIRMGERRDIPVEEWERMQAEERQIRQRRSSSSSGSILEEIKVQVERPQQQVALIKPVGPYEHKELDEIRATPSYFAAEKPVELLDSKKDLTPKKELKKRFKLNRRLIKRANKLAKTEACKAKNERRKAESEIAVCDEAARRARKQLKLALKESKRATKIAEKLHKKMDKIDRKLEKRSQKLEKRQRKLDKRAIKAAKKAAKKQAKLDKKEAKQKNNKSGGSRKQRSASPSSISSSSTGKRASIRREDIGEPVLRSTSRMSIGGTDIVQPTINSLNEPHQQTTFVSTEQSADNNAADMTNEGHPSVRHTITRTVITQGPDGQQHIETSERVLTGNEAEEAALRMELEESNEEHLENSDDYVVVDVVGIEDEEDDQLKVNGVARTDGKQLVGEQ